MNFYNPYQNAYGVPAPNMPPVNQRPMFPEPQQYMQNPIQGGNIWVKGRYEAENYPSNIPLTFWDSTGPYVHRNEIDSSGRKVTKTFKVIEVTDTQPAAPAGEFVTREEFMQFVQSLNYQPKFAPKEETVNE